MRAELQKRIWLRGEFTATFKRFGWRAGFRGRCGVQTALFIEVREEAGDQVTDHVWMCVGKQLRELELVTGDRISFTATVSTYMKGYRRHREDVGDLPSVEQDYKLTRPTAMRKLGDPVDRPMPLFEGAPDAV